MTYRTRGQGICVSKKIFSRHCGKYGKRIPAKVLCRTAGPAPEDCGQTKQEEEKGQKHEYPY
jgi:hypothetical protein